ncbi:swi snf-related matrix-associated actin-dependent regulator of chromatin subfamily a-like protein 1 [Stylonychia lemnae]|uniref:Swi snf-related matrix-associated actin-dependent regulator of chromatin subfamily a-like protein 1 n=1 Tax=Stylonychia lemnae TaxID=5949 RepID=A0A077ZXM6_STYLE|nr:swi snf-related matrix-associated actin-dependent regulator of chromatin subfamily a-like protein 1 [Stylonychia lemnae]|eukprot:CDW74660.1 swi snf-related matrix-associated actin-dependent regulator of chromatin subfamily a-like protein 1 [Stylonychia lemnae]
MAEESKRESSIYEYQQKHWKEFDNPNQTNNEITLSNQISLNKHQSFFKQRNENKPENNYADKLFEKGQEILKDDQQMISQMDKKNTYNEQRKISLPYKKFITFEIFSGAQYGIRFHKFYDEIIKNIIRAIQGAKFLMDIRMWVVGLPYYDQLMEKLKKVCDHNQIHIEEIPPFIMNLVLHKIPFTGPDIQLGNFNYTNDPFGLGKKLTAISINLIYKPEWPLLIVCPNAMRHQWLQEIIRWIPQLKLEYIQIFGTSTNEEISQTAKIYIISYQLLANEQMLQKFEKRKEGRIKVAIVDQASFLKQQDSEWAKVLVPFFINMKRITLLTGCNFYNNPFEIYNLMKIVRPDYIPDYLKFCYRYCDPIKKKCGVEFMVIGVKPIIKIIEKELDGKFLEYEQQNSDRSVFNDILMLNKHEFPSDDQSKRKQLISEFQSLFNKTGLTKIKLIIETCNVLLEKAIKEALNNSQVHHLNFSTFYETVDNSSQTQNILIDEINQIKDLYDQDGIRQQDHLVVGLLNYQTFSKGYKNMSQQATYKRFKKECQNHFEAILFAEYHWKYDVIDKIEEIIKPDGSQVNSQGSKDGIDYKQIRFRNSYFIKSRGSVDEFLSRLLYHQNLQLWEQMEHQEVAQFRLNTSNDLSKYKVQLRIQDVKKKLLENQKEEVKHQLMDNDITVTAKQFQFQHPPTQSYYDIEKDEMKLSQAPVEKYYSKNRISPDDPSYQSSVIHNCKITDPVVQNPEAISEDEEVQHKKFLEQTQINNTQKSQLNSSSKGKKDNMKQQKLVFQKVQKTYVTQDSYQATSDIDEEYEDQSQIFRKQSDQLDIETQQTRLGVNDTQRRDQTSRGITQITQETVKSLSATQLKLNMIDTQMSAGKNSQFSAGGLSQQRTLKDFQKVGFGYYLNKKLQDQIDEQQQKEDKLNMKRKNLERDSQDIEQDPIQDLTINKRIKLK